MGWVVPILGLVLLFTGSLPVGKFPFAMRLVSLPGLTARLSGLLIVLLSIASFSNGTVVIIGWVMAVALLLVSMVASLTSRAM